jgi:hypothetical protein
MLRLLGLLALGAYASAATVATLGIKSPKYTVTSVDGAQLASKTFVYTFCSDRDVNYNTEWIRRQLRRP